MPATIDGGVCHSLSMTEASAEVATHNKVQEGMRGEELCSFHDSARGSKTDERREVEKINEKQ